LEKICTASDAKAEPLAILASLKFQENDRDACAKLYERALAIQPSQSAWRIERARALVSLGRIDEASAEMQIILRGEYDQRLMGFLRGELDEAIRLRRARNEKVTGEN